MEDLVIIGGGPAGLLSAIRAVQNGLDVTVVEKKNLGGFYLNESCIPGKSLVHSANALNASAGEEELGIEGERGMDYEKNLGWRSGVVSHLKRSIENTLKVHGVILKRGNASFTSSEEILVSKEEGEESLAFKNAILASGSKPRELSAVPFGGGVVISSRGFFGLRELPDSLVIIGAGYIGMEIGMACSKMGVDVSVVEVQSQPLPRWDRLLVKPVLEEANRLGMKFYFNLKATDVKAGRNGVTIKLESDKEISAEKCLVAVGRVPNTDGLGLENTDVSLDERGFVEVGNKLQTGDSNIYAAGDVAGPPMLVNKALRDGAVAVDSIVGLENLSRGEIPELVFTDPMIARVGVRPSSADRSSYRVGKARFKEVAAAHIRNERDGFLRLVMDKEKGFVVGADVVGSSASEIIHELSLAIEGGLTVEDLARTVHAHPTLSEIVVRAAQDAGGFPSYTL